MRLYFKFLSMHFRTQLQNRMSFVLMTLGQAMITITSVFAIFILINQNRVVAGFSRDEILIAGSTIMMSFSLAECFGRGFDRFTTLLGNGQFDRMLVRPRNIIFQVFASTADLSRLGRVFVSLIVLIWACSQVTITNFFLLTAMIISGFVVFVCLFIIYGALSFYTTESLEFMNILTDGAREFGKVPFSFYGKYILNFLTYIVPLACVQYYPLLILLGKPAPSIYAYYPLFALLFVIPTLLLWQNGRRHYRSTGS